MIVNVLALMFQNADPVAATFYKVVGIVFILCGVVAVVVAMWVRGRINAAAAETLLMRPGLPIRVLSRWE